MTAFYCIIPSRMKSTRLPQKALKDIAGRPMVVRVAERAAQAGAVDVIVATDHEDIVKACEANGVKALMTSPNHPTGTDRLAETVEKLGLHDDDIVVNVQGDEPLIPIQVVREVAELLAAHPECEMATAAHPIDNVEEFLSPNVVKVVRDDNGNAITFADPLAPRPFPKRPHHATRRIRCTAPHRPLCLSCEIPSTLSGLGASSGGKMGKFGAVACTLLRCQNRRDDSGFSLAARR